LFIADYGVTGEKAVALEDSIMLKDKPVTAGSKILEGYVSPLTATVIDRLADAGFSIAGKTTMNEFGIPTISEKQSETLGAVKAVAEGVVGYALCNDIFGTYRQQVPENSCCYIHPTSNYRSDKIAITNISVVIEWTLDQQVTLVTIRFP
jgi:aspartyl-tRNA(Asn)/glutamyl-tRNA(Gln) amidotransferase subunit A